MLIDKSKRRLLKNICISTHSKPHKRDKSEINAVGVGMNVGILKSEASLYRETKNKSSTKSAFKAIAMGHGNCPLVLYLFLT